MAIYALKKNHGCVITTIRAVQYDGDLSVFSDFWEDRIDTLRVTEDGAAIITDKHGDQKFVMKRDFVFEHPENSGHLVVLSAPNFLDTYREVPE